MLDHALREQLLRLFEGLEASYVFDVTADPGHASRGELLELLEETAACSAKIGCRITDGQGLEFRLLRNEEDTGIHFRAVGLLTPKSRAHLDTLPPGFALYQASTLACCVGAPSLLMCGLSVVNLAILFTSCCFFYCRTRKNVSQSVILLDYCRRLSQTAKRTPAGNPWGHFAGQVSCVRRESAAVNGQEQTRKFLTIYRILRAFQPIFSARISAH